MPTIFPVTTMGSYSKERTDARKMYGRLRERASEKFPQPHRAVPVTFPLRGLQCAETDSFGRRRRRRRAAGDTCPDHYQHC